MFEDYNDYIFIYLLAIKDINDDKFDILTHHFNNYLFQINGSMKLIHHTIIYDYALVSGALQERVL